MSRNFRHRHPGRTQSGRTQSGASGTRPAVSGKAEVGLTITKAFKVLEPLSEQHRARAVLMMCSMWNYKLPHEAYNYLTHKAYDEVDPATNQPYTVESLLEEISSLKAEITRRLAKE
jgi:hypothetical protein